jgi:PEP-CTERM motif-containing protein
MTITRPSKNDSSNSQRRTSTWVAHHRNSVLWLGLILACGLIAKPAGASSVTLITTPDVGAVLLDSITGKQWLTFGNPLNASLSLEEWETVATGNGTGLGSFRLASNVDIMALLSNGGAPIGPFSIFQTGVTSPVDNLITFCGLVYDSGPGCAISTIPGVQSLVETPGTTTGAWTPTSYQFFTVSITGSQLFHPGLGVSGQIDFKSVDATDLDPPNQAWLERSSAVPEPSTVWLLSAGLVGWRGLRFRAKRRSEEPLRDRASCRGRRFNRLDEVAGLDRHALIR